MKHHYLLIALIFSFSNLFAQYLLFDDSYIHEIKITSENANFWNLLDSDYATASEGNVDIPYRAVTVEVDGETLTQVGVRQKGYSSNFSSTTNKKPLKINFGKFVADQEFDNVKKINLANGFGDPAIIKDKIAYDMFRFHGIPAPRVSHANIYINDVYWGVYAIIEQIDKKFLKRNFADKKGELWKNKDVSTLSWQGQDSELYNFELQTNEEDNDWSKFFDFVEFINNSNDSDFENDLESIFDLDEYLRILAIDVITNNWDSHIVHGRNWYLYYEPKIDKMHWLPWDYNFSFDRKIYGSDDISLVIENLQSVLANRVLNAPTFKERYLNYVCEIMEVNFTNDRLEPKLDSQLQLLSNDWANATNNMYPFSEVSNAINGTTWSGTTVYLDNDDRQGFKEYITNRRLAIEENLLSENFTCTSLDLSIAAGDVVINEFMANNGDDSIWMDQDGDFDDWVELYNNTDNDIDLTNYFLSNTDSFIHKWEFTAGTIIPANGYLIVWADKDIEQDGIHTKFSLSKKKGAVILSYIDGTIIDSVTYTEEQEVNKTLSRIPNGQGDFIVAEVTFNDLNSNESLSIDNLSLTDIRIYPNPTDNKINIETKFDKATIYSISGVKLIEAKSSPIDLKCLKHGIYFISIEKNNSIKSKKIIKK